MILQAQLIPQPFKTVQTRPRADHPKSKAWLLVCHDRCGVEQCWNVFLRTQPANGDRRTSDARSDKCEARQIDPITDGDEFAFWQPLTRSQASAVIRDRDNPIDPPCREVKQLRLSPRCAERWPCRV